MGPFISVIIPTLNASETLRECLDHLLQNHLPRDQWEIIVVDCLSTDSTVEIAALYDVRQFSIKSKCRSLARNKGAKEALGDVLLFVDANAIVSADLLQTILKNLESADAFQVKVLKKLKGTSLDSLARFFWRQNTTNQTLSFEKHQEAYPLVNTATFAIKKECFLELDGFSQVFKRWEDRDFGARLVSTGHAIMYLDEISSEKLQGNEKFLKNLSKFILESKYLILYEAMYLDETQKKGRFFLPWKTIFNKKHWPKNQKRPEFFWHVLWSFSLILNSKILKMSQVDKKVVFVPKDPQSFAFSFQRCVYHFNFARGLYFSEKLVTFKTEKGPETFNSYCFHLFKKLKISNEITDKDFILLKALEAKQVILLRKAGHCEN